MVATCRLASRCASGAPLASTLRSQAVHTDDVAAAFHRALGRETSGAFNLSADPMLDTSSVARVLGADLGGLAEGVAFPTPALAHGGLGAALKSLGERRHVPGHVR